MAENNTPELESVVKKALEAVSQYNTERKSKKKGWIAGLAAGILTLVALSLLFWRLFQNNKKHAKIAHERDMLLEQQAQAKVDAQVATAVQEINDLLGKADEHMFEAARLDTQLKEIKAENAHKNEVIAALQTWEDVDAYLAGKK